MVVRSRPTAFDLILTDLGIEFVSKVNADLAGHKICNIYIILGLNFHVIEFYAKFSLFVNLKNVIIVSNLH